MSDPAIEAVKRADPDGWLRPAEYAEEAAREALAPIRKLHKPIAYQSEVTGDLLTDCYYCGSIWPCDTARLIYTTEELEARRAE